jgi:glutaredoxin 3
MSATGVVMYATAWCPFCERARALLARKGIDYREIDVEEDPGLREQMISRSGRRTVPQIFIGERHVGGWDELAALDRAGEIERLLAGESTT